MIEGLAALHRRHVLRVDLAPVPLGARQVSLGRERRLARVVAGHVDAALLGLLDDDLRRVDVHRDDVDALVGEAVGGLGLLDGIDQSPVKTTAVVAFGLTERAPSVNALMFRSTCGMGLAAMKPSLFVFVVIPATIPETYWASSMYPK